MPETCRDMYDNKPYLFHQVGNSRHLETFGLDLPVDGSDVIFVPYY